MGCDIHIVIQRQIGETWQDVPWQRMPYNFPGAPQEIDGIPVAPEVFTNRNYDLFGILANVRNGSGFAGIVMGTGWPSLAPGRGCPEGFDPEAQPPDPHYPDEGSKFMGGHSFTHVMLDELKSYDWDGVSSTLFGVISAKDYEKLPPGAAPASYSGDISGPGILQYDPDEYLKAKRSGMLAERPYVRVVWQESAREATYDWPGKVIPWLEGLADGAPLRLTLGFDS